MTYSAEAEMSLVGACLLEPKQLDAVSGLVEAEDFFFPEYRAMWSALQQLALDGSVDAVSLHERVSDFQDEYGGLPGIVQIVKNTPSARNAKAYAQAVRDKSARRRLQIALQEVIDEAQNSRGDLAELIDKAQSRIAGVIGAKADSVRPVGEWLLDWVDDLDAKFMGVKDPVGLKFNIPELDNMTNGMHPDDLVVLGGESGMGKTVVAAHILDSVCLRQRRPAVMFQLEMRKEKVFNRVVGSHTGIKLDALKDPRRHMDDEGWNLLMALATRVKDAPMVIDDRPGLTPSQIRAAAKRWKEHFGDMGCIIVDHVGIVQPDDRRIPREQQIAEVTKAMKILAKDLGCPVVLLAQINRENTRRADRRPVMTDLRESAALEHNADLILFIYREERYNPDCDRPGIAELIVAKQRDGEVGTVSVVCDLSRSRLSEANTENVDRYYSEFPRQPKSSYADKFAV
jgi:replicative DNA helicase